MSRLPYPDDLTEGEWQLLELLAVNPTTRRGSKPKYGRDARSYFLYRSHRLFLAPFHTWKSQGFFDKSHAAMRNLFRQRRQRNEEPSAGIIDSQSVKTNEQERIKGYDSVKKIKGKKCHVLVNTQGLIINHEVTAANEGDRKGLQHLLDKLQACHKYF